MRALKKTTSYLKLQQDVYIVQILVHLKVIDAMFEQTVAADEVVIEQGADGDFFYVVDTGVYHALIKAKEGEPLLKVFLAHF